ncbi:hypothetical protein AOLI_G00294140 [Acnodon oligacanthus]
MPVTPAQPGCKQGSAGSRQARSVAPHTAENFQEISERVGGATAANEELQQPIGSGTRCGRAAAAANQRRRSVVQLSVESSELPEKQHLLNELSLYNHPSPPLTATGQVFLMSARRPSLWPCLRAALSYGVFFLTTLADITAGQNCSHPIMPEHGGFSCKPSPCRGFPSRSYIYYFCEPGYVLQKVHRSRCHKGHWNPSVPICMPNSAGHAKNEDRVTNSIPSVATTAVGVSIFLLTTTACMVVKSRLYPCQSQSRRSSDQLDLVVDGLPVSLPTYEEAVYGSWGQRLPPLRGPTQLLLASSEHGPLSSLIQPESSQCADASSRSTEALPPPYEEVPLRAADEGNEGEARASHIALSVGKDN